MADAPPPWLPSAEDAVPGWASAGWAEFLTVRKNRDACIHWLLRLSQRIEAAWACEAERRAGLRLLRECLQSLGDHAHADCRWLAGLAPRMLASLDIDERHFLNLMLPIERKWSRGLRDEEFLVTTDDRRMESVAGGSSTSGAGADGESTAGASQLPLVLVLDHLRSAFNVGSIFRSADCLGVSRLYLCGYTATPDDAQVVRTSMGAHAHVAWEWRQHTWQAIDELKAAGMSLIGLETSSRAPFAHEFSFPRSGCALLLGNERHGISPELLGRCDAVVRLPCRGVKNSLNVAVALGMCGHEIARQWSSATSAVPSLQCRADPSHGSAAGVNDASSTSAASAASSSARA